MKQAKKSKVPAIHTPKGTKGMGDFYGTGHRNPLGKVRDSYMVTAPVPKSKLKNPPKALA